MIKTMTSESWTTFSGIMMTTEPISAYGGTQFGRDTLESAADAIRANGLPMHVEHHLGRPLRTRNTDAFIETREDGIDVLRFTVEIHPDDANWAESLGGVSFTITAPIERPEGYIEPISPQLQISADSAWFDDEAILAAESALKAKGIASDQILAERALQFSFVPEPQIFVSIAIDLLTGIGSSVIWDAVVHLFRRRRTPDGGNLDSATKINVTLLDGDTSLTAVIETNSETVAVRALDSIDGLASSIQERSRANHASETGDQHPSAVVWDDPSRAWTPPS